MTGPALMARMARNNAWANARLHGAVAALGEHGFAAPRQGFFPSIRETLIHIHLVDLYYLDALEAGGRGRTVYENPPEFARIGELTEAQRAADARLVGFCDGLGEADLAREVATARGEAGIVLERIADLLLHLFQHQIHHRGQVHNMLSQAGATPPQLDEFHLVFDRHPTAAAFDR